MSERIDVDDPTGFGVVVDALASYDYEEDGNRVRCRFCEQVAPIIGDEPLIHDDDCPTVIARRLQRA